MNSSNTSALSKFRSTQTQHPKNNPIEVGHIRWSRNFDAALQASLETHIPILALFQEVPGCIGCQNFGQQVLTEPTIVRAIEESFLPVLIYNNSSADNDAALLKHYKEPAWNYQVIRFFDGTGKDIIPRADRIWDIKGVIQRLKLALQKAQRDSPNYL